MNGITDYAQVHILSVINRAKAKAHNDVDALHVLLEELEKAEKHIEEREERARQFEREMEKKWRERKRWRRT